MVRMQFELTEDQNRGLEALKDKIKVRTKKDLINNALTLLEWAIQEREKGRIIASVDEQNDRYKELVMPILSAAANT